VSNVSPNVPMFYDNRHIFTQISRLCHVHTQVHTLLDRLVTLFVLWRCFRAQFDTEFPITSTGANAMFTLKTLHVRVDVQLLTYEDVSVCISFTWSPRLHTNVQLKTRWHIRVHVFLTKTYLYPSFVIWDSCLYHVLSHYFDWGEYLYTTFDIQGSVKLMHTDMSSYVKSCT